MQSSGKSLLTLEIPSYTPTLKKWQIVGILNYSYCVVLQSVINAINLPIIFTGYRYFLLHAKQKHCIHCL